MKLKTNLYKNQYENQKNAPANYSSASTIQQVNTHTDYKAQEEIIFECGSNTSNYTAPQINNQKKDNTANVNYLYKALNDLKSNFISKQEIHLLIIKLTQLFYLIQKPSIWMLRRL